MNYFSTIFVCDETNISPIMQYLVSVITLLQWVHCGWGYGHYNRHPMSYGSSGAYGGSPYASSTNYATSSSSSSSSLSPHVSLHGTDNSPCCTLDSWAYNNFNDIRQFANRLRQEYNSMASGSITGYSITYKPWTESIIALSGKTPGELDALCRMVSEQLIADMRKGSLSYSTVSQPNYFEWKAAKTLQPLVAFEDDFGQQQQSLDLEQYQLEGSHNFEGVKTYSHPTEVKVVDGKTYVVHKNISEAHRSSGSGTYENPYVRVIKRNRTVVTTNAMPAYTPAVVYAPSTAFNSGSMVTVPGNVYLPPSPPAVTVSRKKTIRDWVHENMEPGVVGYRPVVNVNADWSTNANAYKPPLHIPVETSSSAEGENFGIGYAPNFSPGSTVTVRRYNKTTITNPDGSNVVRGSESHKKWVDGQLVYDTERPFGEWTVPKDEEWKREERERFFWFLTSAAATSQSLELWQRQQEERLMALAERYHTTLENIQDWHRKELERYRVLLGQYQVQTIDDTAWKRSERGRLDWLIHQNSVTREELERWQQENQDKLTQLARQYRISVEDFKNWQIEELDRLYVYFNDQNNSMMLGPNSDSFVHNSEQERLEELIRQHNATIEQLHNSIKMDQQKLRELSTKYRGNVEDMEKWLKGELSRLGGIINEQHNEMTRINEWQASERERLENIVKQHRGSIGDIDAQMDRDRSYLHTLANKYHVSIEELENWQRAELERLQQQGQAQIEIGINEWQQREHENLKKLIAKNDLTIEEFQVLIINDRKKLENLAQTYQVQVTEIEEWLKKELSSLKNEGLLQEVKKELADWQQKERARLQNIVRQNELTVQDLELKIKTDQSHLNKLASKYQIEVAEIEDWLKTELKRLQSEGLVKVEELQEWQKNERELILGLVQNNKLTIDEFEHKLLADRQRLQDLAKMYNVETHEIDTWIRREGERLQNLGLLQIQEQLNNWQKIERDRLMALVQQNKLSIKELEERIKNDQVHLYSMAHQHQVRVEEIEEWIKQEIKRLQAEGLIEMEKLKDWQTEWRGNLTNMVRERDFTVEEFHKWLLEDRARLQALAMQHNVQLEEIEQWVKNEEQRFISMGLLKPNEKLTNWQEVERRYLERITQEQYHSTEQLEQRLRQDRELLEKLARDYQIQVEEIEKWMKKELTRLRDEGQLQINNLTAWQIAERERLDNLLKKNKQWSAEELEAVLRQDRDHMQSTAFQYHTSVEEVEKWIESEIQRLQHQGKLNIEKLTAWQKEQQQRILSLLQQQSTITLEDFERKVQQDRAFLMNLARQYHVSVNEIEDYVKKVINDLRDKGKFEIENLKAWQLVERDYIKQLINQYKNSLTTEEYEKKLLNDRIHLNQLADHYHINVKEVEEWMIRELHKLRKDSGDQLQKLVAWQVSELEKLKHLIQENNRLNYVQFELELKKEHEHLQQVANQYSVSIQEVEQWLRQQLLNLKTTGQIQVESLTKWQENEQKRLIALCLRQQEAITNEEFERELQRDKNRLEQLAREYNVSVEQIEQWMKNELQRLKNSGLVQVENLTHWQLMERKRLEDWLRKQNKAVNSDELDAFIRRDKERLQRIAQDYHVTVEEIQSWVEQEGARLQLLGLVKGPRNYIWVTTRQPSTSIETSWNNRWTTTDTYTNTQKPQSSEEMWKEQTRAHLQAIVRIKPLTWSEFERYLVEEKPRWEQFARQYHVTVDDIETWLRESAQDLSKQGFIQGDVTVEEWHRVEQKYIQDLIDEKLRKQQQWSIEELERQLRNDRDHLQGLANRYHVAIEVIENWYREELQSLLNQRRIISENLTDWQTAQKDRLYWLISRQPGLSLQQWEHRVLNDKAALNRFCDEYHVSIEELEVWIHNELRRLQNLGLLKVINRASGLRAWQEQERQRLRDIAAELTITEEEFVEFIANDVSFQQQLSHLYGCRREELAPFQRIVINRMNHEGLLDKTALLQVESWQKNERHRLYSFIKDKSYTLDDLRNWQNQESFINGLASKYGVTAQALKNWQMAEFQRLQNLALYYQMNLNQLQDFRDKEISYITFVMHKKLSPQQERVAWGINEATRMSVLQKKSGLVGEDLAKWRRKYYLLCQGRLPFSFGVDGGYEIGGGLTNRTGGLPTIISKDRGDQPPNIYEETIDIEEPGVEGHDILHPLPTAEMREHLSLRPGYENPNTSMDGGSYPIHYSKKEDHYRTPARGRSFGYQNLHNPHNSNYNDKQAHILDGDDEQQQQQLEEDGDYGQQHQEEDEVENFHRTIAHPVRYSPSQKQMQAPVNEGLVVQAELNSSGFLGNLKKKIFG
ncbi:tiggrin isoform X1 [Glossina fuscipes]|uniref:Tiggrin isoform X1 n=2 Tax=Glossina fuscipes TaxID=7396 RepID=A0A9C5ZCG5_9MUSC|nr:tiggrin isoform X1 [Glossina fuscipes]